MSVFNWNAKNTKDMANNPEGENAMNSIISNQAETQNHTNVIEAVVVDDFEQLSKDLENVQIGAGTDVRSIKVPEGGVPAGNYLATISSASHVTHKTGNYPMVTLEIKISAGEFKDLP